MDGEVQLQYKLTVFAFFSLSVNFKSWKIMGMLGSHQLECSVELSHDLVTPYFSQCASPLLNGNNN